MQIVTLMSRTHRVSNLSVTRVLSQIGSCHIYW